MLWFHLDVVHTCPNNGGILKLLRVAFAKFNNSLRYIRNFSNYTSFYLFLQSYELLTVVRPLWVGFWWFLRPLGWNQQLRVVAHTYWSSSTDPCPEFLRAATEISDLRAWMLKSLTNTGDFYQVKCISIGHNFLLQILS